MSIKNLDSLKKKLSSLNETIIEGAVPGFNQSLLKIQRDAKIHAPKMDGDLMRSIHIELNQTESGLTGKVYTTNDHAVYVEFGTGPNGEASNAEVPPGVAIQYKDKGWLVPVQYFPNYQLYGMTAIEINGELFVPTKGQKAQQYMTPAARMNEKTLTKEVSISVAKKLKELEV